MIQMRLYFSILVLFLSAQLGFTQVDFSAAITENGHYDFTMFGMSNNVKGNSTSNLFDCQTDNLSSASAIFSLPTTATGVKKAILYWSGTGLGDLDITFSGPNGLNSNLTAQSVYNDIFSVSGTTKHFFSASYDVTALLNASGTGTYTLSDLDVDRGPTYCSSTLYSGWVVVVIYEDPTLTANTVKIYDGFRGLSNETLDISLTGINVITPLGSNFGSVVWEGDNLDNLGFEGMKINGNTLIDANNPAGQLYNSTNAYANSVTNYNMDLDYFSIAPFVNAGDNQVDISAIAGSDLVFFNVFALTINNELPDATVVIKNYISPCDTRDITLSYTVRNIQSNLELPANVPISFHANSVSGLFLGMAQTPDIIPIGDSLEMTITFEVPASLGSNLTIWAVADNGNTQDELVEDNNNFAYPVSLTDSYSGVDSYIICSGDTLFWGDMVFTEPIDQDFSFTTVGGCDSTIHLNLVITQAKSSSIFIDTCQNTTIVLPDGTAVTEQGNYSATISTVDGCDSTVYVQINFLNENNAVLISGDTLVEMGYDIPLTAEMNFTPDSLRWSPAESISCDSCTYVKINAINSTIYELFTIDEYGCVLKVQHLVRVIKHDRLYIPNVFSPNGNGLNETFKVYADRDVQEILKMQVFDRWGSLVYDSAQDGAFEWRGDSRGKTLKPDVYVYQVVALLLDGRTKVFSGDVTLVK